MRVVTVQLGGFATSFATNVRVSSGGKPPRLADDYRGRPAEKVPQMLHSGEYKMDGDPDKAVRAIFDVAVGEGVGIGREAEQVLPLGRDMAARVKEVVDKWGHTMEVFSDVCNNVYLEKET